MQNNSEYIAARTMGGVLSESAAEYTLPDYNGDIKKILFTDARVIPSASFPSGDSIEYSGVVAYSVIYLDSEDKVSHAEFTSDFEGSVKLATEDLSDFDIDTAVQSYVARPVGPRKLSARCTLASTLYTARNRELEASPMPEGCEYEARMGKAKIRTMCIDRSGEREYAEELAHLDGAMEDEVEVLYTVCNVKADTVSLSDDGAEYKGELEIIALVKQGDSVPFTLEKKVPFCERYFDTDRPYLNMSDTHAEGCLDISSVKCSLNPDDDGVGIVVSVITEGKMRVMGNSEIDVMLDAYLTECESDVRSSTLEYTELLSPSVISFKAGDTLTRASLGLDGTRNILLPTAEVKINDLSLGTDAKIVGEIRFSGIACEINELGDPVYSQIKISVPFKENVNNSSQLSDKTRFEYTAWVKDACIELDNESVRPTAEIGVTVMPLSDKSMRYVSELTPMGERLERDECVVTVYYPESDETLFDISKKYKIPTLRVASVNAITESVFARSDEPISSLGFDKIIIR